MTPDTSSSTTGDAQRRAAVLGSPIAHSLSPALHNAAYAALGLDGWSYDAHDVGETDLTGFVAGLGPEWAGLSLTMPLKRVALRVADRVPERVEAIGAANTLVRGPDAWHAANTDVTGIAVALRAAGAGTGRAVVLGAGGTAQAALAALHEIGFGEVTVLVRDLLRTEELRDAADRLGAAPAIRPVLPDAAAVGKALEGVDVVISALPAGAADHLTGVAGSLGSGTTLLDAVYAPWPTPVAGAAAGAGATIVSGLELLLQQAVAQVELMTGRTGPEAEMRAALDEAVRARG